MKIPPIAQLFTAFVLATMFTLITPIAIFKFHLFLVLLFAGLGILFLLPAIFSFYKFKTTVNPLDTSNTTTLVTSGIYRITRNPMYVGMILLLISFVLWLGAVSAFLSVIVFYFAINGLQIKYEEAALVKLFGQEYLDYKKRVPKWLFI